MDALEHVRLFGMSLQQVEKELDSVEKLLTLDLQRDTEDPDKDAEFYPQFKEVFRREASMMSDHYEVFYCLERSIRDLVSEKLVAEKGANWWDEAVPDPVKQSADKNIQKEQDNGLTPRSTEKIDYTNFGELGEIVRHNAAVFKDIFNNDKAFNKIMTSLNLLRGPIAHCCPLSEDEALRLRLAIADWFRLMS